MQYPRQVTAARGLDQVGEITAAERGTLVTVCRCVSYNNNNNHFISANILEDRAQWRDKTKGLSRLVIENNA